MATYSKVLLSGSTGGKPIKVVATATAGTTIHATGTSATVHDEVWLYATNTSAALVQLTIEFGGTSSPDDLIVVGIPSKSGLSLIIPGLILTGDGAAARTIRAFAGSANDVNITGFVNRITP
jgi:hypothetical protein